jgi:hypothetical protein
VKIALKYLSWQWYIPHEKSRLEVPRMLSDNYLAFIKQYSPLVPNEVIFNIGESGLSDWEELKTKPISVAT